LGAAIIIQAGAGSGKYALDDRRFQELLNAVEVGRAAMRRGSSLDGVEAAVRYMEECGAFNAGKGSCLTVERKVELDAAIMSGEGRRGAGVGAVTCTYHPVSLARWVMEKTPHVLIAGERCRVYLRAAGLEAERLRPSPTAKLRFKMLTEPGTEGRRKTDLWRGFQEGNTVGAVAIDAAGVPSAAVSTGGMWLKLPNRVGDSAVIGAGIYADSKAGAASATGTGEEIIRNSLCLKACEYLMKTDAPGAARRAIKLMTRASGRGTAGIITVDLKGRVGAALNTEAMGRAWYDEVKGRAVVQI
jgi:beta-aspartyl-peptidase (threonine type)